MSQRWTKLYNNEWLDGSIRVDLTPAERSIWADLLALAGLSRREGFIERSQGIPYTIRDLAHRFNLCGPEDETVDTGVKLVQDTIEKCIKEGRIEIQGDGVMHITNWDRYQSIPSGKERPLPETPKERELREKHVQSRLNRKYPASVPTKVVRVKTDVKTGEVLDKEEEIITE